MLKLLALSCKTWNVAKPGAWLLRPPPGAQQSQDSSLLSVELQVLHSQKTITQSFLGLVKIPLIDHSVCCYWTIPCE